jgi:hypothetical protein
LYQLSLHQLTMKINLISCLYLPVAVFVFLQTLNTKVAEGAEFVLMNRIISYDLNTSDAFWLVTPDGSMPTNWLTPNNYFSGMIYSRYEIISVPTSTPCAIGWGFFQHKNPQHTVLGELCELAPTLSGTGAIAYKTSSPTTWWETDGGVDFSKVSDIQSMGIILYSKKPGNGSGWPVCKSNNGGDPGGVAWNDRFNWYPITIRVTVVAVSAGSTFSGWDKYIIDPSHRQPTPAYEIDFINETTDKVVPSTDQFSIYSGMAYPVDGAGEKWPITPGQDHNFRTKAGSGLLVSETQHFRAPVRPATPGFIIDKVNHRTTTAVTSDYEYSTQADMSGAVSGSGAYVSIPAGTTMYFMKKATPTSFKSKVQALDENTRLPIPHELLVFNDTIDFPNNTDTNGFYYFYYNADMPVDWKSPEDYYNGEIFTRYEIISEKTEEIVGLQMGFWQLLPPETGKLHETMSPMGIMNGTGSVVTTQSSPYLWWKLTAGFDYTRMDLTWHMGINPWKVDPVNGDNKQIRQENTSVWAERNTKWFPMKVRVTVVAVGAYQTFSGWDNYIDTNTGNKKPTPAVGIDYINEQTNITIPVSVEYSLNAGMSGAVNGSGQKIALTPGKDVYFRTKAGDGLYASDIQHLSVPANPLAPVITINYADETTSVIGTTTEWSANATLLPATQGWNSAVRLTPGTDLYFRLKATSGAFKSAVQHLVVPVRPAAPGITINYINETTGSIPSSMEWSANAPMTSSTQGQGAPLAVTPGNDLYFRSRTSSSAFRSDIQHLTVPTRPSAPAFTINYIQEKTSEPVTVNDEYSLNSDMTGATAGTNAQITVTPGTDLYFRTKATGTAFRSGIQLLDVPSVPPPPVFTINYSTGATNETAGENIAISKNAGFTGPLIGNGAVWPLEAGQDLYFKQIADNSSFGSEPSHLVVPGSNFLGYSGADTITQNKFSMYTILLDQTAAFSLDDLRVTNATVQNLRAGNVFDVYPLAKGPVSVIIPANTITNNTFASNEVVVYYNVVTGIGEYESIDFSIYPNPGKDGIIFIQTNLNIPYSVGIYSVDGKLMKTLDVYEGEHQQINLKDLQKGMYFLRINTKDRVSLHKVIIE